MSDEAVVHHGALSIPYAWAAGRHATRFYQEIAENQKIYGTRCPECRRVLIPARKSCSRCFAETTEWVEVGPRGVVKSFTVVHYAEPSIQPLPPPFAYGLIQLDGADTAFIHLLGEVDLSRIQTGMRVEAVFADEAKGNILDIKYFRPFDNM
ncbi:MAG: Zn-ribbon domain-containing OB-fold protein [Acidobacteria bacterium]|nr:Zn-ribbon domain-containing OB-fold protein [Acidobacteriota bacterium]